MQVVFAIAGTLIAAALVAVLGDTSEHEAYLAARSMQEQQMAGSWSADHKPLQTLSQVEAKARLMAKAEKAGLGKLATKAPGDQSSDDDESGNGDVKETMANKLFGAEAGQGGNGYQPPYEVDEDSDIGLISSFPCLASALVSTQLPALLASSLTARTCQHEDFLQRRLPLAASSSCLSVWNRDDFEHGTMRAYMQRGGFLRAEQHAYSTCC